MKAGVSGEVAAGRMVRVCVVVETQAEACATVALCGAVWLVAGGGGRC
jgi:hypothetical protein